MHSQAQSFNKSPNIEIITLTFDKVVFSEIENNGNPIVVLFFATWCTHCHNQLDNISDLYYDWQSETGVKIIAISIDDVRSVQKVGPFVSGKGWEFDVYLDENGDLKRALGMSNLPFSLILDGNNNIVWKSSSYVQGDEYNILSVLQKLHAEKSSN